MTFAEFEDLYVGVCCQESSCLPKVSTAGHFFRRCSTYVEASTFIGCSLPLAGVLQPPSKEMEDQEVGQNFQAIVAVRNPFGIH